MCITTLCETVVRIATLCETIVCIATSGHLLCFSSHCLSLFLQDSLPISQVPLLPTSDKGAWWWVSCGGLCCAHGVHHGACACGNPVIAPVSGQMRRMGWGQDSSSPNLPSTRPAHLLRGQGEGDPAGYMKAHSVPSPSSLARWREQRAGEVTSHIWRERGRWKAVVQSSWANGLPRP